MNMCSPQLSLITLLTFLFYSLLSRLNLQDLIRLFPMALRGSRTVLATTPQVHLLNIPIPPLPLGVCKH